MPGVRSELQQTQSEQVIPLDVVVVVSLPVVVLPDVVPALPPAPPLVLVLLPHPEESASTTPADEIKRDSFMSPRIFMHSLQSREAPRHPQFACHSWRLARGASARVAGSRLRPGAATGPFAPVD